MNLTTEARYKLEKGDAIAIIWTVEDVLFLTENEDGESVLSVEEAQEVLQYVLENHDSSWGVSWDTLQDAIAVLFPEVGDE